MKLKEKPKLEIYKKKVEPIKKQYIDPKTIKDKRIKKDKIIKDKNEGIENKNQKENDSIDLTFYDTINCSLNDFNDFIVDINEIIKRDDNNKK